MVPLCSVSVCGCFGGGLIAVLNISYQFSSEKLGVVFIFLLSVDLFHICSLLLSEDF